MNFEKKLEEIKPEVIKTLQELLQIKSVLELDPNKLSKEAPFGEGISKALTYMLELGKKDGFSVYNDEYYAGHIAYGENDSDIVGLLCHLDVVPEGNNWDYPPYGAVIVDNKLYARGSNDDKGPTIATYYALKLIKEANIKLKKQVRIILGTDEETGWRGVSHYFKHNPMPQVGFAPDASFPPIYAEKGRMAYDLALKEHNCCEIKNDIIISMQGGERYNVVLDHVETVATADLSVEFLKYLAMNNLKGDCVKEGSLYRYTIEGIAAHAMEPEAGRNAGTYMCDFFKDYSHNSLVKYVAKYHHLAYHMEKFGLDYCDYEMGFITCNIGIIDINKESSRVTLDLRYPVRYDIDNFKKVLQTVMDENNLVITKARNKEPHYVSPQDELVVKLYDAYVKHTGDTVNKPFTIGGGTYASMMPHAVAFGMAMPDEPELAHQPNEFINLDYFFKSILIYIDAIIALGEIDA